MSNLPVSESGLSLNIVSSLDFSFLKAKMSMSFAKIDDDYTFTILPSSDMPNESVQLCDLIDDVKELIKGYDASLVPNDLNADSIGTAISDVNEASNANGNNELQDSTDFTKIQVTLVQAFLLIRKGHPTEFALEIDVNLTDLFPKESCFLTVDRLVLAVWNTKRASILSRMNITDVKALLMEDIPTA